MALKIMLQRIYLSLSFVELRKRDTNDVTSLLKYKNVIELVCAEGYKKPYYSVTAGLMVDYKEQVFITGIKTNIQCSICHVYLKKKELVT